MKTKEDRIKTVYGGGGHVVILGAGASIASTLRNPEKYNKQLPSMDNFIELVGLTDIVNSLPKNLKTKNFEQLYSNLHKNNPQSNEILEIENRVYDYFKDMSLPENEATIYDYLVLSLRPRDLIATFNWDPFLFQAYNRNSKIADRPGILFLHGSVAIGYNKEDKRCGPAGWYARDTKNLFEPTKLLYPVVEKNYIQDEFIRMEWDIVKKRLNAKSTIRVTVFGYGAPNTDVEAMSLMSSAWGTANKRNMEQFEIIDKKPEDKVIKRWKKFIHSHHYDYTDNYFNSSLANNPRRTSESYFQHILPLKYEDAFSESNPVPFDIKTLKELWDWHKPLIEAEKDCKEQQAKKEK